MKTKVAALSAALMVLLAASFVAAADVDLEAKIAAAQTAADHEAIAAVYSEQAADALKQAERHERMGNRYERGGKAHGMSVHCKRLVEEYRGAAKELEALAAGHRQMAADVGK
jgi:hypothetical protein